MHERKHHEPIDKEDSLMMKEGRILCCARCTAALAVHEGCEEKTVTLCEDCHKNQKIAPGEYAYALRLWLIHDLKLVTAKDLPSFWPRQRSGDPMTINEIIQIVVRNDMQTLPCGNTCACDNVSRKQRGNSSQKMDLCVFLRMQEEGLRKTALLLYWWLFHYQKSGSHPDFWPTYKDNGVMSPREMIIHALGIS